MIYQEVLDKVCKIIAKQLEISPDEVSASLRLSENLGADSLDRVYIMMALEKECDTTLPGEEFDEAIEKMTYVSDLVKLVCDKKNIQYPQPTVAPIKKAPQPNTVAHHVSETPLNQQIVALETTLAKFWQDSAKRSQFLAKPYRPRAR